MLAVLRLLTRLGEICLAGPARIARMTLQVVALPTPRA